RHLAGAFFPGNAGVPPLFKHQRFVELLEGKSGQDARVPREERAGWKPALPEASAPTLIARLALLGRVERLALDHLGKRVAHDRGHAGAGQFVGVRARRRNLGERLDRPTAWFAAGDAGEGFARLAGLERTAQMPVLRAERH